MLLDSLQDWIPDRTSLVIGVLPVHGPLVGLHAGSCSPNRWHHDPNHRPWRTFRVDFRIAGLRRSPHNHTYPRSVTPTSPPRCTSLPRPALGKCHFGGTRPPTPYPATHTHTHIHTSPGTPTTHGLSTDYLRIITGLSLQIITVSNKIRLTCPTYMAFVHACLHFSSFAWDTAAGRASSIDFASTKSPTLGCKYAAL